MIELDVTLDELPLREANGFQIGLLPSVRVFIHAVDSANWTIHAIALEGYRRAQRLGQRGEFKFCDIRMDDPLYSILLGSVVANGTPQIEDAITDKIIDIRADRACEFERV